MNHGTHTSGRGSFVDRVTQRWVRATGRAVTWLDYPWLEGPVGDVNVIGTDFFHRFAERRGWTVIEAGEARGLLEHFAVVAGPTCEPAQVDPEVARFYERTSDYDFDVWSEWSRTFRPFGGALGTIFSRRLQQLNVPLSPLDTKLGITNGESFGQITNFACGEHDSCGSTIGCEGLARGMTCIAAEVNIISMGQVEPVSPLRLQHRRGDLAAGDERRDLKTPFLTSGDRAGRPPSAARRSEWP
jgi:hypothetical protein